MKSIFKFTFLKLTLLYFAFHSLNTFSLPCAVEQEDPRLQQICDNNVFDSNKNNLSSHADFQNYRADCRLFLSRHPDQLDIIKRVVVVRISDLPFIGELISGGTVNELGRRFIEDVPGTTFPIGTLILFPENINTLPLEQTIRYVRHSALFHKAETDSERITITHGPNFAGIRNSPRGDLMTYSSGAFVIDGFNFVKAPQNENFSILNGNATSGVTIKNSGFKRSGDTDQVSVIFRVNNNGMIDLSDVDVDCSANNSTNFSCVRVECGALRQNCPSSMVTVNGLNVTMSQNPETDSSTEPGRAFETVAINRFAVNNIHVAANNASRPISFQLNDFATNVVGCISNIIIDSSTQGAKINIGGSASARGTIGFFGNGFQSDVGVGANVLESATYVGFVTGTQANMTYVNRDNDCFHRISPTSIAAEACPSTSLLHDVLTTNIASTVDASSQASVVSAISTRLMAANSTSLPDSTSILGVIEMSSVKSEIVDQIDSTTPFVVSSEELIEMTSTLTLPEDSSTSFDAIISSSSQPEFTDDDEMVESTQETRPSSTTPPSLDEIAVTKASSNAFNPSTTDVSKAFTTKVLSSIFSDAPPSLSDSLDLTKRASVVPPIIETTTPSSTIPSGGNNYNLLIGAGVGVIAVVAIATVTGIVICYVVKKNSYRTYTLKRL